MNYYQTKYTGDFSLDDAYYFYLTNPCKDWDGAIRVPTRQSISRSMLATHERYGKAEKQQAQQKITNLQTEGRLLWWSDHHFFHDKIIKYGERPFADIPSMHKAMVDNYMQEVTDNDIVVFGGDLAFGHWDEVAELFKNAPGYKIYVLGNHDVSKKDGKIPLLDYAVFDAVVMCLDIEVGGQKYWVTHYPMDDLLIPADVLNIHGHTHQNEYNGNPATHFNMSVELTGYRPVSLEKVLTKKSF